VAQIYENSLVNSNTATNGGAIACDGGGTVFLWNTQVALNQASQDGGAVYLNDGCEYQQFGGAFLQGLLLNEAGGFGGAISASNGSSIEITGSTAGLGLAAVISNTAANGGGVAVSGGSSLYAANASISDNTAASTGGGIRSTNGHIVIERTVPGAQCFSEVRCSNVSNNNATGSDPGFSGGGGIATFGGTLEVRGTYMENNNAQFGSAIRARFMPLDGFDHPITMVGNVFAENSGAPQVVYLDESSADIAFSTFVDNTDMSRVIEMAYPTTSSDPNEVRVSGSIFDHPGDTLPGVELTTSGQFVTADCNRYEPNTTGDLDMGTRSSTIAPLFVDRAGGDFNLISGHVLLDWCDWSILGSESDVSANGFVRPVDDSSIGNLHGTYDLGALERYLPDVIFADDLD
jgi:predicted outer membrane repeat protein